MRLLVLIAALAAPASVAFAQALSDWQSAPIMAGSWGYAATAVGSEAAFTDARATRRVVVKCSRATRRVSIGVTSTTAAPTLQLSATDMTRVLPAAFSAQAFQITAELPAQDALLDALAFSRGRFSISWPGSAALVVPAWPEIARSIEDCRS